MRDVGPRNGPLERDRVQGGDSLVWEVYLKGGERALLEEKGHAMNETSSK